MANAADSQGRKWAAIALGTFVVLVSYWVAVFTLATPLEDAEATPEAGGALALSIALVPIAFFALASVSERPHRWWGTLAATAVAVLAGALAGFVARDLASALVGGFGMGGAVALRADRDGWLARRGAAVVMVTGYTAIIVRVAPGLAILLAPLLPFLAIGLADVFADRIKERRAGAGTE